MDPTGLFSVSPAVIEQALARAGLAEVAGAGPEDPLADIAAVIAIVGTIVSASDAPSAPATAAAGSCPPRDPCKELRNRLKEHEQKLADYINDPLGNDNKGTLWMAYLFNEGGRATSIYEGRIRNLQGQIENFKKLLEECERQHGKP